MYALVLIMIVALGIVLCLLGAIGNNLGNNLQSIGLRKTREVIPLQNGEEGSHEKNHMWLTGKVDPKKEVRSGPL